MSWISPDGRRQRGRNGTWRATLADVHPPEIEGVPGDGRVPILTIARQLAAGGEEIAAAVAERLGWLLLDQELVRRVACELRVNPHRVESLDERVETFWERAGQYLYGGSWGLTVWSLPPTLSSEHAALAATRLIHEAAREAPAVIVGHGAQCILKRHPRSVHVLVRADLPFRLSRARVAFPGQGADPEAWLARSDRDREHFLRAHFHEDWLDARLYDLCVDTGRFGLSRATDLVYSAVQKALR